MHSAQIGVVLRLLCSGGGGCATATVAGGGCATATVAGGACVTATGVGPHVGREMVMGMEEGPGWTEACVVPNSFSMIIN